MATLTIRRFDDDAYAQLRKDAEANNRSLEAEARHRLERSVRKPIGKAELLVELRAHHAEMRARYGVLSDSTPIIRQMREEE